MLCLLVLVLSVFSYFFVEKPFRKMSSCKGKRIFVLFTRCFETHVCFVLFLSLCSALVIQNNGYVNRFSDLNIIYGKNEFNNKVLESQAWSIIGTLAKNNGLDYHSNTWNWKSASEFEKKYSWFSKDENIQKVLVVGDSHSNDMFNALFLNQSFFKGLEFARYAILPTSSDKEMSDLFSSPNFIDANVVLVSVNFLHEDRITSLSDFISSILVFNKKVIVSLITPTYNHVNNGKTIFDNMVLQGNIADIGAINAVYYQSVLKDVHRNNQKVIDVVSQYKDVVIVNKFEIACEVSEEECYGLTPDGYKALYNSNHWTIKGSEFFGRRIAEAGWFDGF